MILKSFYIIEGFLKFSFLVSLALNPSQVRSLAYLISTLAFIRQTGIYKAFFFKNNNFKSIFFNDYLHNLFFLWIIGQAPLFPYYTPIIIHILIGFIEFLLYIGCSHHLLTRL